MSLLTRKGRSLWGLIGRSLRVFPSLTWCLERRTVDSSKIQTNFLRAMLMLPRPSLSCGNSTCLKPPQYFKEGRLNPFFANNVDIPFARARRLKPCPRKATVRSGKQTRAYVAIYRHCVKSNSSSRWDE